MMTNRIHTRLIGILFILPFFFYGGGNALIDSVLQVSNYLSVLPQHKMSFIVGALLMLLNSLDVAAIGVLLFPVIAERSKNIALGYIAGRIAEAMLAAVGVVSLLCIMTIADNTSSGGLSGAAEMLAVLAQKANYWLYQTAMMALCVGSIGFCVILWKFHIIPAALALMMLVGYIVLLLGVILEFFGYSVGVICSVPGGLCEIGFGAWLLVKGMRE